MSTRVKLSSSSIKDNKRSDSPGYFTLSSNSDSDTGDCTGDISGEDEEFIHPRQHDRSLSQIRNDDNFADSSSSTIVYNFQGSVNSRDGDIKGQSLSSNQEEMGFLSENNIPPRDMARVISPFKPRNQHDDRSTPPSPPPRPPPPFSYTSTFPPPVPKKINAPGYSSATFSATSPRTPSMPMIRTLGSASIPTISFSSSGDNPAPDHALVTGASISTHNSSATRRMANRHIAQYSTIASLRLTKTSRF